MLATGAFAWTCQAVSVSETDCEGRPAASTCLLAKTSIAVRSEGQSSQSSLWEDVGESNLLTEDEEVGGRFHELPEHSMDSSFTSTSFWSCVHLVLRSILVVLCLHLAMLFVKSRTRSESVTEFDSCGRTEWKSVKPAPAVESSGPVSGFVDFCSALHLAAAEANVENLQRLLKGSSESSEDAKDVKPLLCDVNAVDAWDETALHMAARCGSIEACELLIAAKADVNALNANDETPLKVTGSVSLCHLLLQHGAHLGVPVPEDAVPHSCTTALMESLLKHEDNE